MKLHLDPKDIEKFQPKDKAVLTPLTISIRNIFSKGLRYSQSIPNLTESSTISASSVLEPKVLPKSSFQDIHHKLDTPSSSQYSLLLDDSATPRKPHFRLSKYVSFSSRPEHKSIIENKKQMDNKENLIYTDSLPSLLKTPGHKDSNSKSINEPYVISAHITKADSYSNLPKDNLDSKSKTYKILVVKNGQKWSINRNIDDFWELYLKIKESFPGKKIPNFPQKSGILGYSFPTDFVFTKRDKLNSILQFFLSDSTISSSSIIKVFLADESAVTPLKTKYLDISTPLRDNRIVDNEKEVGQRAIKSLYKLSTSERKPGFDYKTRGSAYRNSEFFTPRSRNSLISSGSPLTPSHTQQLKRPRASISRAMRKRFGFRKGVQVVGQNVPTKKQTPIKQKYSDTSNSLSSENNYYTENSDVDSILGSDSLESKAKDPSSNTVVGHNEAEEIELDVELMSRRKHKVSLDDFHLLSIIGKGAYGNVMLARHKDTAKVYAIKVISKKRVLSKPSDISRVMTERQVLKQVINHPFLVGLEYAFQSNTQLYFCLDYVNGGELFYHLQNEICFSENRTRFYVAEITSAIGYLHSLDIIYRDLKPENCLLDQFGHLRIVDFGLVKILGGSDPQRSRAYTFCGTPEYMAPEILLRHPYGKEVDWYCLGAISYEMIYGLPPYYSSNPTVMYNNIINETLEFPIFTKKRQAVGNLTKNFIANLLVKQPLRRLGSGPNGTENVMNHPYFNGINWSKVYKKEYMPPFVPKTSSIFELSNISPEFRNEPIPDSIRDEGKVTLPLCENIPKEGIRNTSIKESGLSSFPHIDEVKSDGNDLRFKKPNLYKNGNLTNTVEEATDAFRGFSFDSIRG
ncbi:Serine/threonine-protein kinase Sgk1 [Smittium mucronatum]|uniref:Serine/threonine-protein kinase Sgk1 n=1 Tax=Smittium mucronatum TaxID=133383 RepID=A0A1R0H670_9FUNG|nr:Serine/threonine-protein kinase Sgk1 [Smittium mucronatum]